MKFLLKKYFVILLSVIYLSAVNANLIVWIEYKVNYDFIVKFLCLQKDEPENFCHGSCHLKKNLEQNEEQNKPAEKQNRELPNYSISYHIDSINSEQEYFSVKNIRYISYTTNNFISNVIEPDSPPPKLL